MFVYDYLNKGCKGVCRFFDVIIFLEICKICRGKLEEVLLLIVLYILKCLIVLEFIGDVSDVEVEEGILKDFV